jgi:hypothetical protein
MDSFVNLNIDDLLSCINGNEFKVNYPPHNPVKDEFEKFVNNEISKRRKNSSISNLRDFHNFIKRTLITVVAKMFSKQSNRLSLLDISCGRGGDLFKYSAAGI